MTDLKTICYAMTTNPTSGNFLFSTSNNAPSDVVFNNGVNWSNQTANITPLTTAGVTLTNIGGINYGAVGAVWYFGASAKFDTLCLHFSTGTDNTSRTVTWEYWNGTSWTTIAQSGTTQRIQSTNVGGGVTIQNNTQFQFKLHPNIYNDWSTTSVNGGSSLFYVRMTVVSGAFTSASLASVSVWDHFSRYGHTSFDNILTTTDDISFTDVTLVGRSNVAGAFTFTANTTNARLYLGSDTNTVLGIRTLLSTAGTVGTGVWEYWTGASWVTLPYEAYGSPTTSLGDKETLKSTSSNYMVVTAPLTSWATTTVNGLSKYWIRFRVTSNYTVSPVFQLISAFKDQTLSRTVNIPETTNRTFQSVFAKIHMYNPIPTGFNKIHMFGRIGGSGDFVPVNIGENNPLGTFTSIGGRVFSTTANDGVFTDDTTDATDSGSNDVDITNTVNSNLYFCYPNDAKWTKSNLVLAFNPQSLAQGAVVAWEYWNGSAWTEFTPIVYNADVHLNQRFNASFTVQLPILFNWTANTVDGFTGYNIRRRITTIYSSSPTSYTTILTSYPSVNNVSFTNTAENNSHSMFVDLTRLFTDSFSGTSNLVELKIAGENITGILGDNLVYSAELFITYKADNQNTRIKTVFIPLDSSSTTLSGTLTSIGTNQIPQLSTYLPEASKTIRNFYILSTGNDIVNTSMATEFAMRLDSDPARYTWAQFSGGLTGNIFKYIFVQDNIDTGSTHDIQMAVTARNLNIRNWQMYAVVTYEYDASTTTRAINSLILPFETSSVFIPQNDSSNPEKIRKDFYIQEPGTIDNERVGCYLSFSNIGAVNLLVKEKSESTYTDLFWGAPEVTCGGFRYSWRLPSQNLSRGLNNIGIDMYANYNSSTVPSCAYTCGYFIVNYQSDVSSVGIEAHNKTIMCLTNLMGNSARNNKYPNTLTNPFTYWFINDFGMVGEFYQTTAINPGPTLDNRFIIENPANTGANNATLGAGGGWQENESLFYDVITADRDVIKKYPGDLHDRRKVDIFNGGNFNIEYGYSTVNGCAHSIAACHEIYYTITGSVVGYSGDGSGLTVTFYDDDTSEVLFQTTTAVGGTFTAVWYDNTRNIVCDAYDSGLDAYAESPPGIAGTDTFTINFNGGSGGTTSYAFIG